ncbi:MAG TPA: hypothetical protein VFC54_03140 [Pseudolabrys sp.]|nr:hypothetical protein [Pseudolabrys sp.]
MNAPKIEPVADTAQGPLVFLVGINLVGMRRHGLSKSEIYALRAAYYDLFFGEGEFRARVDQVAASHGSDALVIRMIEFIRAGKRPLTMAVKRSEANEDP